MPVCYASEARSTWFVFAFGLACFGASAYGWLAGAWPFGVIEGLWGILALHRWQRARTAEEHRQRDTRLTAPSETSA